MTVTETHHEHFDSSIDISDTTFVTLLEVRGSNQCSKCGKISENITKIRLFARNSPKSNFPEFIGGNQCTKNLLF